jgi:hypothetical protein
MEFVRAVKTANLVTALRDFRAEAAAQKCLLRGGRDRPRPTDERSV